MTTPSTTSVQLRDVIDSDLDVFFAQQSDEEANRMAGFTSEDPHDKSAFLAHWAKILSDSSNRNQTILYGGEVTGYIARFDLLGKPSIAYWIGKALWGRGIPTEALQQFLLQLPDRTLYARVASDNRGSIRVLEKASFTRIGSERSYANTRGSDIEELIFCLEQPQPPSGARRTP